MVVVPEPAVKGCRSFAAGAVDGAVRPAAEEGADEALGLAVRLRSIGSSAEMADPEPAAGERRRGALVRQDLGVRQLAVVVDRNVHELPAGDATPVTVDPGLALAGAA